MFICVLLVWLIPVYEACAVAGIAQGLCPLLCRSGQVTQKMLDAPDKRLFLGIGGLEAASQLLGFVGASKLPGQHESCLTFALP